MKWYLKVLRQYADFSGRARRKEYWMFVLFNLIFMIISIIADAVCRWTVAGLPYGVFFCFYTAAMWLPGLAVVVRRLHDVGKSGWWILLGMIPLVGGIIILVYMLTDSKPETNRFGPDPKKIDGYGRRAGAKNTATALIVASVCWILVFIYDEIRFYISDSYLYSEANPAILFLRRLLFLSAPAVLIITGAILMREKEKTKPAVISLMITSGIWILWSVYNLIASVQGGNPAFIISANILRLTVPAALLLLGISWMENSDNSKIISVLLIAGSIIWMVQLFHIAVVSRHSYHYLKDFPEFFIYRQIVIVPVALSVLGYYLSVHKNKTMEPAEDIQ